MPHLRPHFRFMFNSSNARLEMGFWHFFWEKFIFGITFHDFLSRFFSFGSPVLEFCNRRVGFYWSSSVGFWRSSTDQGKLRPGRGPTNRTLDLQNKKKVCWKTKNTEVSTHSDDLLYLSMCSLSIATTALQPVPHPVTFLKDFCKAQSSSSQVSFAPFQWKERKKEACRRDLLILLKHTTESGSRELR